MVLSKVQTHGLVVIYESAMKELPGKPTPLVKDYRKSKNSYFSRYRETWVDKLKNSYSVSKFCYISDPVRFMLKEGDKIMKRSVNEDDFYSAQCVGTHDRENNDNMDAKK